MTNDDLDDLKSRLLDIPYILHLLDLDQGLKRTTKGAAILCPWHAEDTPSCHVTIGSEGTLRAFCFGCGKSSDVLGLIAVARHLDMTYDFVQILDIASAIAGYTPPQGNIAPPPVKQKEALVYPDEKLIIRLWDEYSLPADQQIISRNWLAERKIPYNYNEFSSYCRFMLFTGTQVDASWWNKWYYTGHRLIFLLRDHSGTSKNFSARYIGNSNNPDIPKTKYPKGYSKKGLCLMNNRAIRHFSSDDLKSGILSITEGEPDFLTAVNSFSSVIGITGHGSITEDYTEGLNRFRKIVICTHNDKAGDIYAENIKALVSDTVDVRRYCFDGK